MMNYDRWRKDIEVSDDEDDTHPNVDTPSLFRWRHESRVIREREMEEERKEIQRKKEVLKESKKVVEKMKEQNQTNPVVAKIEEECAKEARKLAEQEAAFAKKERLCPWNVDTLAKDGISKTVINADPKSDQSLTDEEKGDRLCAFVEENSKLLKKFGMLRRPLDSKEFLTENPQLVCEDTASYLTLFCLELAMEEKFDLMEHVSKQCVSLQFLLELALQLDRDPRECVPSFFAQIGRSEESEYNEAFKERLLEFRKKIRARAEEKMKVLVAEEKEKQRKARLGPGGLDPFEVLESLPDVLKECFEARDISMLQKAFSEMPLKEAEYHLKRCIDSGLWCPGPQAKKDDGPEKQQMKKDSSQKQEIATGENSDATVRKAGEVSGSTSFPFSAGVVLSLSLIVLLISIGVLYFTM